MKTDEIKEGHWYWLFGGQGPMLCVNPNVNAIPKKDSWGTHWKDPVVGFGEDLGFGLSINYWASPEQVSQVVDRESLERFIAQGVPRLGEDSHSVAKARTALQWLSSLQEGGSR